MKGGPPKVSIIIPLYNSESHIKLAVDSCLNQTYKNVEIIVIDDGSSDNSKGAISEYIITGKVRYFYQENKERSVARNFGLNVAKGDFINFLDSDDLLHSSKIKKHMEYMEEHKECFATYSSVEYFDDVTNENLSTKGHDCTSSEIVDDLISGNFIPIQSVLFKKTDVRFDESINVLEDWRFWIDAFYKQRVGYLNETLSFVRVNKQKFKIYRLNTRVAQVRFLKKLIEDKRFKKLRLRMAFSMVKYSVGFIFLKVNPFIR